jgi:ketosteroid isomerase-like protein
VTATLSGSATLPAWLTFNAATGTFTGTPENADTGTANITVTATDAAGATASDSFTLTVANVNDAPSLTGAIADQTAEEGKAFLFNLPENTFSDPDAGDTLTLSARLSDSSDLPDWLTFNAATGTFTGTPGNADTGTANITVTATDAAGATASDSFNITVEGNPPPVVAAPIPDRTATEDTLFSFTLPAGTFTDEGDTLSYQAVTTADWLTFDAVTATFSGTPTNADVGSAQVTVTATDSIGKTVSDTFTVTVANVNDAPTVQTPIPDQNGEGDEPFSFTVPAGTFTDVDAGDTLTNSATLAGGSPLPAWLTFDPAAGTFTGTPPNAEAGTFNIAVTATDTAGATVSDSFALNVAENPLPNQTATEDTAFTFTIPDSALPGTDPANPSTLTATLADGSPLPAWLSFDAATGTFSGTPLNQLNQDGTVRDDTGTAEILVTATGGALTAPVSDSFLLTVENINDTPVGGAAGDIPSQQALQDKAFNLTIALDYFLDVDPGDTLTYSYTATDAAGSPATLNWLTLNPATGTFSGTPAEADSGVFNLTATATDSAGAKASSTFVLGVGSQGITRALFDAYETALLSGDSQPVQDFVTDGVIWDIAGDPARIPFAGDSQDVAAFFRTAMQRYFPTDFTVLDVVPSADNPNRLAVRVGQTGVSYQTGQSFQGDMTFIVELNDLGKVAELDGYYNTYPVAAALADQPAPAIPDDDPLTGQLPAAVDTAADAAAAEQVAADTWTNLSNGDLAAASDLYAPDAVYSFAVGGPSFLPYVGAAQGFTSDGATLAADFSNAGPIINELLGQLGPVVQQGNISIQETFVEGNRVLVRLREEGATARETGNQYDLDLLSWFTISADGKVQSNEVIVDTYQTVNALRPGELFALSPNPDQTRHQPPYFVAGSLANNMLLTYDENGNFTGVLGQANNYDTDEFQGPIALTYGPDGDVYVSAGINRANNNIINAVLKFDGISGEFAGNGDNGFTGDAAGGVTDAFGDAFVFLDFATGQPIPHPETGNLGSIVNAVTGEPFDPAVDDPSVAVPGLLIPTGIKFGPSSAANDAGKENLYVASGFTSRILEYDGETGDFLGTFGFRPNGAPGNLIIPTEDNTQPDFTIFVFGPDGDIYICSLGSDDDGNQSNGAGAVLHFVGPDRAGPNGEAPGTLLGVFGDATNAFEYTSSSGQRQRLNEPSALAFGPDLNLYVNSAQTGEVLQYAGPLSDNPGQFLGVYADLKDTENGPAVPTGAVADSLILSGIGFGPDGTLYVGNSFNNQQGIPIAGSSLCAYSGPLSANPGQYLGAFGEATTGESRLLFPTTQEFVFTKNSYANPNGTPTERYGKVAFVVAANTDGPAAAPGTPGTLINDGTDALVAFDQAGNRLYDIGVELFGADSPLQGIGGIVLSPEGNILVASQLTDRVLEFNGLTGAFIGVFGAASAEGSGLDFPADVALGPNNDLYVADQDNERVLRFNGYSGDFVGVAVDASQETPGVVERLTSLAFGPDGRLYAGYNPPRTDDPSTPEVEPAQLGAAEIRVYNSETGELEGSIGGLDFVADLSFGPDGRLYVSDTPVEILDPLSGQPLPDPATGQPRPNSIKVYDIPNRYPLLSTPDPVTGLPAGDPNAQRTFPQTPVAQLALNSGEGGGIEVGPDGRILSSNAGLGSVSFYTFDSATSTIAAAGSPIEVPLPPGAFPQDGGLDVDQLSRPTGAIFMQELTY